MLLHMLYALEISAMIGVAYQPHLAQAVGVDPLGWGSQLGVIGMLGALLWWQMAKTTPEIQKLHTDEVNRSLSAYSNYSGKINENIVEMTLEIKGMRADAEKTQKEWVAKLDERPCLGLDGFKKIEAAITEQVCHKNA